SRRRTRSGPATASTSARRRWFSASRSNQAAVSCGSKVYLAGWHALSRDAKGVGSAAGAMHALRIRSGRATQLITGATVMSKKQLIVAGLFVFAFLYVSLLALINLLGGGRAAAGGGGGSAVAANAPGNPGVAMKSVNDDGSIQAKVSSLDRDKFHI